jgi:hypothetical protein
VFRRARANRFATDEARHAPPRAVRIPRWFNACDIASRVFAPVWRIASTTGSKPDANSSAAATWVARPSAPARGRLLGLASLAPLERFEASAAFVRSAIRLRWSEWLKRSASAAASHSAQT